MIKCYLQVCETEKINCYTGKGYLDDGAPIITHMYNHKTFAFTCPKSEYCHSIMGINCHLPYLVFVLIFLYCLEWITKVLCL